MAKKIHRALWGDPDNPMPLGDATLEVYVLEDGLHVVTGGGFNRAVGIKTHLRDIRRIMAQSGLIDCISCELASSLEHPIRFIRPKRGGSPAYGYPATVVGDFCRDILRARREDTLPKRHHALAVKCEILSGALVQVGIEALIDQWTGYDEVKDRKTLQEILDKYLRREFAAWSKRFPDEFYKRIFELRGWKWKGMQVNRPSVVGHYTNDIVWARLAPDLLKHLRELNPPDERGRRKVKHHQWLTNEIGHPRLQEHLWAVIALMRAASNWDQFMRSLQRAFPKMNTNLELPLDEDGDID